MNRNQGLIDEVKALEEKVRGLKPQNAQIACAIGGLHTCRDHLLWHGEEPVATVTATEELVVVPVKKNGAVVDAKVK